MKPWLFIVFIVAGVALTGCARSEPTPDAVALEATVAQRIFATLTASAPTATTIPTAAPTPTSTSSAMPAEAPATPSATVEPPTDTPVPPTPTATSVPETPTPEGPRAVVQSPSMNVRSGPGTAHPVIATATQSQAFAVTGRSNDGTWLEVDLADGQVGWISAALVETNVTTDQIALAVTIPTAPVSLPTSTPAPVATMASSTVAQRDLEVTYINLHYECVKREWEYRGDLRGDPLARFTLWGYRSFQADMYIKNNGTTPITPPWQPKRWIITDGTTEYYSDLMWQWSPSSGLYAQPTITQGQTAGWTFTAFPIDQNQWVKAAEFVWNGQVYRQDFDLGPYGNSYNYKDCGFIPSHTERPTPTPRP